MLDQLDQDDNFLYNYETDESEELLLTYIFQTIDFWSVVILLRRRRKVLETAIDCCCIGMLFVQFFCISLS